MTTAINALDAQVDAAFAIRGMRGASLRARNLLALFIGSILALTGLGAVVAPAAHATAVGTTWTTQSSPNAAAMPKLRP